MNIKYYSVDAIRALAMTLVIVVHTKHYFFSPDITPILYSFFKVIGTVGVPLFVILTGYLMFDRKYENPEYLKKFLSNNLFPLFISFELWNIIWNILRYSYVFDKPQKWTSVIKAAFFMGDTMSALWYLPMTLALYLGLPIISIAVRKIDLLSYKKLLLAALIISGTIIPSIAPIILLTGHTPSTHSVLKMNIFGASVWGESVWMIYLLAGYAISKGLFKSIKSFHLLFFGALCPIAMMCFIETTPYTVQHYDFILVVLLSITTFELLTRIEYFLSKYTLIHPLFEKISESSFSVYMLHVYIAGALIQLLKLYNIDPIFKTASLTSLSIILYVLFIASIILLIQLIINLLKSNLFIRRYLFLIK